MSEGSLAFRTLSALGAKGIVRVCVPDVALQMHFANHRAVAEHQQAATEALDVLRCLSPKKFRAKMEEASVLITTQVQELSTALETRVQNWAREAAVMILPIQGNHGRQVVEAYFSGGAPFKRPKHREDFPDGFIWQALLDLTAAATITV